MRVIPEMRHLFPRASGVLLREPVAVDAAALADIEFDARVKAFSRIPKKSREEWLTSFTERIGTHDWLAVVALPEKIVAGRASIARVEFEDDRPVLDGPWRHELSIFIGTPFWRRGLGRIVAHELIGLAFDTLQAKAVTATVDPDNAPARRLLECFRFRHVGTKVAAGDGAWQAGHLIYELAPRA
jgi:RimJ/RimL family protein N-acetyltransferase